MLRKPSLFFSNADCTNNNYHFQNLLALTTIFLIHLRIHFWGVSTAQPGTERPGKLQLGNTEEVFVQTEQGNLNNITFCNGNVSQVPANASGFLAVDCLRNNGGPVKPPADDFNFTVNVDITNSTSHVASTDPNGGIRNLVKRASGHGPNITISNGPSPIDASLAGIGKNTVINPLFHLDGAIGKKKNHQDSN